MSERKTTLEQELRERGELIYPTVGVSMRPLIRQGRDIPVLVPPPPGRLRKYDVPLYRRANGQLVLHRILRVRETDYLLCGDNCWTVESGVTDAQIVGLLTAVIRDGVPLPVTDWRCRLYVGLWCGCFPLRAALLRALGFAKCRLNKRKEP